MEWNQVVKNFIAFHHREKVVVVVVVVEEMDLESGNN